jgi:hypothetical protein
VGCHVVIVRTDVLEEIITSIIRVTRISEIGTMLAVISNRSTLQSNILTFQKTAFFIATSVKISNLTLNFCWQPLLSNDYFVRAVVLRQLV